MTGRGRILMLHTGGTLGMRPRHPDRVLAPGEFGATVLEHVPELAQIAELETRVLYNLDSADMGPPHWRRLAAAVYAARDRFDGVVITHGTDAMAYTAAALSYLLRGLPFPVILTGSQRPLADIHTDGRTNLIGAVDLALRPIPEVAIYFDGRLLRGNRAVKVSTFAFGAFRSPNHPPLAEVGTEVKLMASPLSPREPFRVFGDFDPRVAVIWLQPGDDGTALSALVGADLVAVLLVAYGFGNIPVRRRRVAKAIGQLVAAGKVVAIGSQAPGGSVDLRRYAGGRLALDMGAVGIGDMSLEAATVKLMYLAGTHGNAEAIRAGLTVPIAGEVTAEA